MMSYKNRRKKQTSALRAVLFFVILMIGLMIAGGVWGVQSLSKISTAPSPQEEQRYKFLEAIGPGAKRIQAVYDVPASIIMAQAALESDFGNSELGAKHHNLFGVKASPGMDQVTLTTKEFVDGEWITIHANFREYPDWTASMIDHAQLIRRGTTDQPNRYAQVNTSGTYKDAAKGLLAGGYATDPKYADKLIAVIETYSLETYDK